MGVHLDFNLHVQQLVQWIYLRLLQQQQVVTSLQQQIANLGSSQPPEFRMTTSGNLIVSNLNNFNFRSTTILSGEKLNGEKRTTSPGPNLFGLGVKSSAT